MHFRGDDIQNFVYRHLDNEILWATSMPCVVAGETSTGAAVERLEPHRLPEEPEPDIVGALLGVGRRPFHGIAGIAQTLEPDAYDSFFNWNFFDEILFRNEYFSPYIFEEIAAGLLNSDPALNEEFRKKQAEDELAALTGQKNELDQQIASENTQLNQMKQQLRQLQQALAQLDQKPGKGDDDLDFTY